MQGMRLFEICVAPPASIRFDFEENAVNGTIRAVPAIQETLCLPVQLPPTSLQVSTVSRLAENDKPLEWGAELYE